MTLVELVLLNVVSREFVVTYTHAKLLYAFTQLVSAHACASYVAGLQIVNSVAI